MQRDKAIVIGAGVGGLASAALLAARGLEVTVVEMASAPGGKMRRVAAGDVEVDGGPTVFTMRDIFDAIFAACDASLDDYLTLTPATTLARHAWGPDPTGDRLDLFADRDASADAIGAFAGATEARGYRAFCAEAKQIFTSLDRPFMRSQRGSPVALAWHMGRANFRDLVTKRPFETLWKALGDHFADPRLRQLFGRYATYCGSSPFECPATLMLIAHVEASGVWLLEGGMHSLARALEALATKHGAQFRYGTAVNEILVEHGRAAGVVLANGERLTAGSVICNADPSAIADVGRAARCNMPYRAIPPADARSGRWCGPRTATPPAFRCIITTSFSRAIIRRSSPILPPPACRRRRRSMSARRTATMPVPPRPAPNASRFSSMRRQVATAPDLPSGDRPMPIADAGDFGAGRAFGDAAPGSHDPDDAGRVRGAVSFDGWSPLWTGLARMGGVLPPARRPDTDPWSLLRGREHAPGRRRADGGAQRRPCRRYPAQGPRFDVEVDANGYAWWYIDACSEDGRHGLTIIAFIGSVFSPYYKLSGRHSPENHCAINVALTGPRGNAWAMTERGKASLARDADNFVVGPSALRWDGNVLVIDIDEVSAPLPVRVRGQVRVYPEMIGTTGFNLDPAGKHRWHPVAPAPASR